jgi:hypothetical protein
LRFFGAVVRLSPVVMVSSVLPLVPGVMYVHRVQLAQRLHARYYGTTTDEGLQIMANANTDTKYQARETWLAEAAQQLYPKFEQIGFKLPVFRIGVGFGPTGARKESTKILGVTLHTSIAADNINEVWISPENADSIQMLETMVHEMIHVATNLNTGVPGNVHGGTFAEAATRIGLEGPLTATHAGPDLRMDLELIAASLGRYPGALVDTSRLKARVPVGPDGRPVRASSGPKTQNTRMVKLVCSDNECPCGGYTVRTTRKWIEVGLPSCPSGTEMHEA